MPDDNPLNRLARKGNFDQVSWLHFTLQLGGQVIVKQTADLRDIDGDFNKSSHAKRNDLARRLYGWQEGNAGNAQTIHSLNPQAHAIPFDHISNAWDASKTTQYITGNGIVIRIFQAQSELLVNLLDQGHAIGRVAHGIHDEQNDHEDLNELVGISEDLRKIGFDPASASAPFVATLVDVTGLVIYFSVAWLILRGTLL